MVLYWHVILHMHSTHDHRYLTAVDVIMYMPVYIFVYIGHTLTFFMQYRYDIYANQCFFFYETLNGIRKK